MHSGSGLYFSDIDLYIFFVFLLILIISLQVGMIIEFSKYEARN